MCTVVSCEELLKEGVKEAVVTCTTTIEEAMKNDELVSVIGLLIVRQK